MATRDIRVTHIGGQQDDHEQVVQYKDEIEAYRLIPRNDMAMLDVYRLDEVVAEGGIPVASFRHILTAIPQIATEYVDQHPLPAIRIPPL